MLPTTRLLATALAATVALPAALLDDGKLYGQRFSWRVFYFLILKGDGNERAAPATHRQ